VAKHELNRSEIGIVVQKMGSKLGLNYKLEEKPTHANGCNQGLLLQFMNGIFGPLKKEDAVSS